MEQNHNNVWANCLAVISDNISTQAYKTWFSPIKPVKLDNSVLTIQVPSQFFYEWLEEHYVSLLRKTIRKELGTDARLEYSIIMEHNLEGNQASPYTVKVPTSHRAATRIPDVNLPIVGQPPPLKNPFVIPCLMYTQIDTNYNPNYAFDTSFA